jgi:hypothetical protein
MEIHYLEAQLINENDTFLWITEGDVKAETESEIIAVQDKALNSKYYATKILKIQMTVNVMCKSNWIREQNNY